MLVCSYIRVCVHVSRWIRRVAAFIAVVILLHVAKLCGDSSRHSPNVLAKVNVCTLFTYHSLTPIILIPAFHQSGNNSGVIHAGIYYKPGTLKAQLCVKGHKLMLDYCREKNIAHRVCGKLIVATEASQLGALDDIYARGERRV